MGLQNYREAIHCCFFDSKEHTRSTEASTADRPVPEVSVKQKLVVMLQIK